MSRRRHAPRAARLPQLRGAEVDLGPRLTVVQGPNGAGKTNLLEALYFGCTGRSCRTTNERELVRFDAPVARVEVRGPRRATATTCSSVGIQPGEPKRFKVDGAPAERLPDVAAPAAGRRVPARPARAGQGRRRRCGARTSTRSSPRCGRPARRRGAPTPARSPSATRCSRGCAAGGSRAALAAWNLELARHGIALTRDRAAAVELLRPRFATRGAGARADRRGRAALPPALAARRTPEELAAELDERADADLERGFTTHGPHRDDLALLREGRELRTYGSQGQQRLALLALLLAEREALGDERGAAPLMLLDDVMSELDATRRERLVERLRVGQSVVTTTDLAHVPGADDADVVRLRVEAGAVVAEEVPALDGTTHACSRTRSGRSRAVWLRRRRSPRFSASGRRPSAM